MIYVRKDVHNDVLQNFSSNFQISFTTEKNIKSTT